MIYFGTQSKRGILVHRNISQNGHGDGITYRTWMDIGHYQNKGIYCYFIVS